MADYKEHWREQYDRQQALFERVVASHSRLKELESKANREFGAPDLFYRFYHHSFKAYRIQEFTKEMTLLFQEIAEGRELNKWFLKIVKEGTGRSFDLSHNDDWLGHVRPQFEAYFHARMFLDQMIWCAENMGKAEMLLPSQWAAVLYLFNLR
jgi:hypothetical protein